MQNCVQCLDNNIKVAGRIQQIHTLFLHPFSMSSMSNVCVFKVTSMFMYVHSRERRLALHQLQVAADVIRSCPAEHPLRLVANQKAPVPTVRNYSKLMEFWQVALFCSPPALCRPSSRLATKANPPEDCRPCNDGGTGQCILANIIILVASDSLYHCTILLFFTPYCVFGVCLSKTSVCVSSVFPWSIQCNVA